MVRIRDVAWVLAAAAVTLAGSPPALAGPITLTQYEHFQFVRDQLVKQGVTIPPSTGN